MKRRTLEEKWLGKEAFPVKAVLEFLMKAAKECEKEAHSMQLSGSSGGHARYRGIADGLWRAVQYINEFRDGKR
jgi:hypothetical protein